MEDERLKHSRQPTVSDVAIPFVFRKIALRCVPVNIYFGIIAGTTSDKVGDLCDEEFVGAKRSKLRVLWYTNAPVSISGPILTPNLGQRFVEDVEENLAVDWGRCQFESYKLVRVRFSGFIEKIFLTFIDDVVEAIVFGGFTDSR